MVCLHLNHLFPFLPPTHIHCQWCSYLALLKTTDSFTWNSLWRFWYASEVNRIECTLEAHWSCSHGITCKQIWSEYWWVWVLYIAAKGYTALENWISAYQDELTGWEAIVHQIKYYRQRNHCDFNFTMLYHWNLAISKQASFFPNVATTAEQKGAINTHHKPSQQPSQWSHGRRNLEWIMNNNAILFECVSKPLQEEDLIDSHPMHIRCASSQCAFMWMQLIRIGCASRCPCETTLRWLLQDTSVSNS